MFEFACIGVPAAIVNSGLKYIQKKIELAFQVRAQRGVRLVRWGMCDVMRCIIRLGSRAEGFDQPQVHPEEGLGWPSS